MKKFVFSLLCSILMFFSLGCNSATLRGVLQGLQSYRIPQSPPPTNVYFPSKYGSPEERELYYRQKEIEALEKQAEAIERQNSILQYGHPNLSSPTF